VAGRLGSLDEHSQRCRGGHSAPPRHAAVMSMPGHFMNTMSTLEYNTPTLTQEYEYVGEVLLMSMSTQVRRDS
jgi:hypothetical protein